MQPKDSSRFVPRLGAIAGWLALAGILTFSVIGPQLIAGQRVSGSIDPAVIRAYYAHTPLAPFSAAEVIVMLFFVPFVLALRQSLSGSEPARFLATLGLLFAMAAVPLYLAETALQATLVTVAIRGGDILPLFRFWDILYNSALYVLEAGYAGAFALAMRDTPAFPRWMPVYGLGVALLQLLNVMALFAGIPDGATVIGNLALMGWFVGANLGLGRLARSSRTASPAGVPQGA